MEIDNILQWIRKYAEERIDSSILSSNQLIPPYIVMDFAAKGLFGMHIKKEWGGLELSTRDMLRVLEQLASIDISIAILILDSILSAHTLQTGGTDVVKSQYLREMASGRILSAVAITESGAGSNPRAIESIAYQNKAGNWVLNGTKEWVGYASWARFINVFAIVQDSSGERRGVSGFLVPVNSKGVEIGDVCQTMGLKGFPKHSVSFNNVIVPPENLIGELGYGIDLAQGTMMYMRMCMGAICLGGIKQCIRVVENFASKREIVTGIMLDNPVIRSMMSDMILKGVLLESLVYKVSEKIDSHEEIHDAAYIVCKTAGGEFFGEVTDKLIQLLGARGYALASLAPKMYSDARPFRIFEGTTEVLINYLGSLSYFESSDIYTFIKESMCNQLLSENFSTIVREIKNKYTMPSSVVSESSAKIFAYSAIGETLQWFILKLFVQERYNREPSKLLSAALSYVESQIKIVYHKHINYPIDMMLPANLITTYVRDFSADIGTVTPKRYQRQEKIDDLFIDFKSDDSNAMQQKFLTDWNQTYVGFRKENFKVVFEEVVKKYSTRIAVALDSQCLSYKDLNKRANQLAHYLMGSFPMPKDSLVAVYMERSIDAIVAILAVLKAGAGYVPLDPKYPKDRLDAMLTQTQPVCILTSNNVSLKKIKTHTKIIDVGGIAKLDTYSTENPSNIVSPTSLAYVIFTSGSTGTPKGVMVEQRSLVDFAMLSAEKYSLNATDVVLQFASLSFDASVEEIFSCLCVGAKLVLRSSQMIDSFETFLSTCNEKAITVLDLPTTFWMKLAHYASDNKLKLPPSLRVVILGGDKLIPSFLGHWDSLNRPDIFLWDTYGPTEATVVATSSLLRGGKKDMLLSAEPSKVSIGQPDKNVKIYLLDENMQLTRAGEEGEIFIGGAHIARGYLNQKALTNERFIENPFVEKNEIMNAYNLRLYRTGDIAYLGNDGCLHFIGRKDRQVKIRNYRIELDGIENLIRKIENVDQVVVLAKSVNSSSKQILAYVKLKSGDSDSLDNIAIELKRSLPNYAMPAFFTRVDRFPLTVSGKINYQALLALPQPKKSYDTQEKLVKATNTEQKLIRIWQQLFGGLIELESNFFSSGGHSLSVMELVSKIKETFSVQITPREIYRHSDLRVLAGYIDTLHLNTKLENKLITTNLSDTHTPDSFPLTLSQKQIFVHDQLVKNSILYNESAMLKFSGAISQATFEDCIGKLTRSHPALRTRFHVKNNTIVQSLLAEQPCYVTYEDVSSVEKFNRISYIKRKTMQVLNQPFDLDAPPLVRYVLFNINAEETWVFVVMHHIIMDGVSFYNLFLPQLSNLLSENAEPMEYIEDKAYTKLISLEAKSPPQSVLDFWAKKLKNVTRSVLPHDINSRKELQLSTLSGDQVCFNLPIEAVRMISQKSKVSHFAAILGVFNLLLGQYTQENETTLAIVTANREKGHENLIGAFLNTLILKTSWDDNNSVGDFFYMQQEAVLEILENALPFDALCRHLKTPRLGSSDNPLFSIVVVYEPPVRQAFNFEVDRSFVHSGTAKYDVMLEIEERRDEIKARLEYKTALYSQEKIVAFADYFKKLLVAIASSQSKSLKEIAFFGLDDQKEILQFFNADYISKPCHRLFEEVVARQPDSVAINSPSESVTYLDLNARANQVAHCLREQNIFQGPETRIGLCISRSVNLLVYLVGILKAGASYIPLDASYPDERLLLMVNDAKLSFIITDKSRDILLTQNDVPVLSVDALDQQCMQKSTNNIVPYDNEMDMTSYIIYTSGSTGVPKGVVMKHRMLSNLVQWQVKRSPAAALNTLQYTPISFDVSFQEIFSTLCGGGRLTLISDEIRKDPIALINYLTHYAIERLFIPVSLLQQIAAVSSNNLGKAPPCLQEIIVAGEQLLITDSIRSFMHDSDVKILDNQYGPSESHVVTAHRLKTSEVDQWPDLPSIGVPLPNVYLCVLDQHRRPVPMNVPGELYIGLLGTGYGYWGKPTLTERKYINELFEQGTLFKTGDLVKYDNRGVMQWLSRIDNQIKIRGHRIEIEEIEAALMQRTDVEKAVVSFVDDIEGYSKKLAAYIVASDSLTNQQDGLSQMQLRLKYNEFLSKILPDYMLPSHYSFLEEIPYTLSGKINRRKLPVPDFKLKEETPQDQSTYSFLQRELCKLWGAVLSIDSESIGGHDDFFMLGGTSLLAMNLLIQLNKMFSLQLPLVVLLENKTIFQLSAYIENQHQIKSNNLIQLRKGLLKSKIVLIPGSGGDLMYFMELLNAIEMDCDIFGLIPPNMTKASSSLMSYLSIPDLASFYIDTVEREHKSSFWEDCYFVGHSVGGSVAYEITYQLQQKGKKVYPIILDIPVPNDLSEAKLGQITWSEKRWLTAVTQTFSISAGVDLTVKSEDIEHCSLDEAYKLAVNKLQEKSLIDKNKQFSGMASVEMIKRVVFAMRYADRAYFIHKHPKTTFDFMLVRATKQEERMEDDVLQDDSLGQYWGWDRISTGKITYREIEGASHFSILKRPYVTELAALIEKHIEDTQILAQKDSKPSPLIEEGSSILPMILPLKSQKEKDSREAANRLLSRPTVPTFFKSSSMVDSDQPLLAHYNYTITMLLNVITQAVTIGPWGIAAHEVTRTASYYTAVVLRACCEDALTALRDNPQERGFPSGLLQSINEDMFPLMRGLALGRQFKHHAERVEAALLKGDSELLDLLLQQTDETTQLSV